MKKLTTTVYQPRTTHQKELGFTLIELLLYVSLLSLFIGSAVLLAWNVVYGGIQSQIQQEVNHAVRFASKRIAYEVRNATAVTSVSTTSLCLASASPTHNPTRIYTSGGRLRIGWGGGVGDCSSTTNDASLTHPNVVTTVTFTDLSVSPVSEHIHYTITVESSAERVGWNHQESVSGSVELRSN